MSDEKQSRFGSFEIDNVMLLWGVFTGAIVGGLVTLFTAPKSGKESREQITETAGTAIRQIETAIPTPTDPVKDSMAEGKAAARRRRNTLRPDRK
ncbi:MAG: YtxH domain-containing protein [Chloroflexota bacterium]